jgi:hypothetical protein
MQAPRSCHVSPVSKLPYAPGFRLRPSSLRSWLCGATKEPGGFVVNRRKPRELDATSTPSSLDLATTSSRLDVGFVE